MSWRIEFMRAFRSLGLSALSWPRARPGFSPARAPQPGPVARWNFDDASAGAVVVDAASGARTRSAPLQYAPGVSGTALRFDGYTSVPRPQGPAGPAARRRIHRRGLVAPAALPWGGARS